jgi:sporulation protein YhbH
MTVVGESGLPHDAGRRDSLHHRERLRKKITEQLKERIGEEDIVASGPEKKIRVPVKGTKHWQFIFDRGKGEGVGSGDGKPGDVLGPPGADAPGDGEAGTEPGEELYEVWLDMNDVEELLFSELQLPRLKAKTGADIEAVQTVYDQIARKGPQLDKKSTLRENLLRNAKRGRVSLGGIDKPDLRYLSYRDVPRPRNRAVIFLAMDVSGSMNVDRKRMARLFFYWCVQFLRSRYELTEIVFLAHTTEAREVDEEQFFGRVESGGTKVSSVFEAVEEIQRDRYPADDWNIYVLHVSDGDNFTLDNQRALELIRRLTEFCSLVGYLEVDPGSESSHKLSKYYEEEAADLDGFVSAHATDDRALWPALRKFFAADDVEAAIR